MLKNYFKIAFRNLWKNKKLAFINIFGLATGIACSLLIFLFVKDETSYDRFNADAGNIHRIVKDFINDDGSRIPDATSPAALAPAMQRDIPEVVSVARVYPSWGGTWLVSYGDKKITEERIFRVDSSFFDVFTFPFVKGNPRTALNDVHSIVITETVAKRYFGNEDPMGKILKVNPSGDMMVTGIVRDVPSNSHFHFDFLISFRQLGNLDANWDMYNYYTYAKIKAGTNISAFDKKIQGVYEHDQRERYSAFYSQPLAGIHLTSHLKWEIEANSDKLYVYIFAIVGLFILLIAAINYINLATAKSSLRSKEVGIRKVSGAVRASLIKQFLLESILTCFIASLIAIIIAQLLSPTVNEITQKTLSVSANPVILLFVLLVTVLIGLVAGLFPAFYLSSFKPITVLKGFKLNENRTLSLRKALVVVQFTISIGLIIGALIIAQQVKYIQSAKMGFDKEQILVVRNIQYLSAPDRNALLNSIRQIPGVKKAAPSGGVFGGGFSTTRLNPKGSDKEQQLNFTSVGYDYFDVMGMEFKEGRGFSAAFPSDTMNRGIPGGPLDQNIGSLVINEQAVKDFGLGSPAVGKQLRWSNDGDTSYYVTVVGVVKDFHFTSLRNAIKPFGFISAQGWQSNFTLKLSTTNIPGTISQLGKEWRKFTSERPFEYSFLDESFAKLYTSEAHFQKLFISLVVLGMLIACLGLLGLATFAAERRIKEIGIRKVLGASVASVVGLLSKDFLKLVLIGLIIAIPIAWYAMDKWLEDFAYRVQIGWWVFGVAGLLALVIALLTVSFEAVKAAIANPVKSLRTE